MRVTEPWRSRLYMAAGVVCGVTVALSPWLWLSLTAAALCFAIYVVGFIVQGLPGRKRRSRFTIGRGAFVSLPVASPGLNVVIGLLMVGFFTSFVLREHESTGEIDPVLTVMTIVMAALTTAQAILAWPPLYVALTPRGVQWGSALHRRLVPWDALAPGGPPTPAPRTERVALAVTRPEAVIIKGTKFSVGPLERPVIGDRFDVHLWLMADAIRWYVEHPEDRPAIGTQEEHTRLLAALGKLAAARQA